MAHVHAVDAEGALAQPPGRERVDKVGERAGVGRPPRLGPPRGLRLVGRLERLEPGPASEGDGLALGHKLREVVGDEVAERPVLEPERRVAPGPEPPARLLEGEHLGVEQADRAGVAGAADERAPEDVELAEPRRAVALDGEPAERLGPRAEPEVHGLLARPCVEHADARLEADERRHEVVRAGRDVGEPVEARRVGDGADRRPAQVDVDARERPARLGVGDAARDRCLRAGGRRQCGQEDEDERAPCHADPGVPGKNTATHQVGGVCRQRAARYPFRTRSAKAAIRRTASSIWSSAVA